MVLKVSKVNWQKTNDWLIINNVEKSFHAVCGSLSFEIISTVN